MSKQTTVTYSDSDFALACQSWLFIRFQHIWLFSLVSIRKYVRSAFSAVKKLIKKICFQGLLKSCEKNKGTWPEKAILFFAPFPFLTPIFPLFSRGKKINRWAFRVFHNPWLASHSQSLCAAFQLRRVIKLSSLQFKWVNIYLQLAGAVFSPRMQRSFLTRICLCGGIIYTL